MKPPRLIEIVGEVGQICAQLAEQPAVVRGSVGEEESRSAFGYRQFAERWDRERRRGRAALSHGDCALHRNTDRERTNVIGKERLFGARQHERAFDKRRGVLALAEFPAAFEKIEHGLRQRRRSASHFLGARDRHEGAFNRSPLLRITR